MKNPWPHPSIKVFIGLLLVSHHLYNYLLSHHSSISSCALVATMSSCLTFILLISFRISTKTTTSILNDKLKGVSSIDSHGVMWYTHSTLGYSSIQSSFAFSNHIFKSYNVIWFVTFACPFDWGWTMEVSLWSVIIYTESFEFVVIDCQ